MSSQNRSIIGAILIIVSTLCTAFILSSLTQSLGWLDATSNNRYTLSEGTAKILGAVKRPLTATLYYSKTAVSKVGTEQLLRYNRAYFYTRDLLIAYERLAGGKLTFVERDPLPFTDIAEEAVDVGVQQFDLRVAGQFFFFGLAVAADTGAREVLPWINANEENLLEYKITKMIERVSRPSKKKIGVVGGLDVVGENLSREMKDLRRFQGQTGGETWSIIEWLKLDYDIEKIETTATSLPEDLDFLMVVHPKNFSDKLLYGIDQYVLRGGRLVAFVDPFCLADQPPNNPRNPYASFSYARGSDLNRLSTAWGVKMTTGKIIGDRDLALIDQGVQLLPYNLFSGQGDCLSKVNPITEPLASSERAKLLLAAAGRLEKVADAKVEFVPLLQTTREGGTRTFSGMDLMSMQQNPEQLWRAADKGADNGFVLAGERIVTAAIVSGKFKSAFPDGLPGAATNGGDNVDPKDGEKPDAKDGEKPDAKDGEKKPAEPKHLKEAVAENSVVIVADVDVISSGRMFVNPPNSFPPDQFSNKELLLNALDYLGGSGELMSIRSRAPARREFDHIESIRREAAKRTQDKVDSIKREIESFQATLSDLNSKATEKNVGVLQGEALQQQREAKKKIAAKERELRDVQRGAVEEVESVKWHAQLFNAVGMPLLVGLIGLVLWIVSLSRRSKKMREDMA